MLHAVKPPPGPRGLAIARDLFDFRSGDLLAAWRSLHRRYGETVRLNLGLLDVWSFAGPEGIYDALVTEHKSLVKGIGYAGLRKLLGEGLITTDAPHWASHRQKLNPLFSPAATEDYAGTIYDAVQLGVTELEGPARRGETIDVTAAMLRLTMRVISRAAFGVDLADGHDEVTAAFNYAFGYIAAAIAHPFRPPLFVPTPANRRYHKAFATIEKFVVGLIEQSVRHPDAGSINGQIFKALEGSSHQMLRDEVVSLYFAGFETTARTMTFLIHLLGKHRQYHEPLRAEAAAFGRPDGAAAVLKQLPLACEIVNETLRLFPPVAILARQPVADCEIDGYPVKAGRLLVIVPFVAQRDPRYWPAGDSFAPDPENPLHKRVTHRGAFVPFGGGPRICLGKHFAMVEMAIATALLASRFDWQLLDEREPELEFNGTIHPRKPLLAKLSLRA